jgi:hypothetical protein
MAARSIMATKNLFAVLGYSIGIAGLLLATRAHDALAQDEGKNEKAEEKEIMFLTPYDSVLAKQLREKGNVVLAVVRPHKPQPQQACRISDFKKTEGPTPQVATYYVESVLLSRKPRTEAKAAGYFLKSMNPGTTLRNITAKGTSEANLNAGEAHGRTVRLTVCAAMHSAYSENSVKELPNK